MFVEDACLQCPVNHYCPSKLLKLGCPDQQTFLSDGVNYTIPTSEPGSIHSFDCKCNIYGGFQGKVSTVSTKSSIHSILLLFIIVLIRPFDQAGSLLSCQPCPDGYFSTPGMTMCEMCPIGYYTTLSNAVGMGSSSCTECPEETPLTNKAGSTSLSDCVRCIDGDFFNGTVNTYSCFIFSVGVSAMFLLTLV